MTTRAEVEQRITAVYGFMVDGMSRDEIVQISAKRWGVRTRQADNYIARATQKLAEAGRVQREIMLGLALARLNMMYSEERLRRNNGLALGIQKEINEIAGLRQMNVRVDDWRSQAIADIKAGLIDFEALADVFDRDLAAELFTLAGVPVQAGAGQTENSRPAGGR